MYGDITGRWNAWVKAGWMTEQPVGMPVRFKERGESLVQHWNISSGKHSLYNYQILLLIISSEINMVRGAPLTLTWLTLGAVVSSQFNIVILIKLICFDRKWFGSVNRIHWMTFVIWKNALFHQTDRHLMKLIDVSTHSPMPDLNDDEPQRLLFDVLCQLTIYYTISTFMMWLSWWNM